MSTRVFLYKVEMTCEGCANTISNVLNRNRDKGIQSFDVDLKQKIVTVKGTLDSNSILEILQKTGKAVSFLGERK
ncbi:UNVERIFIED_CONTAM: hypothetical protein PYX00_010708 [Menopon gallinae]|uniref:Copper transport protein ATOX1 n=1 Tax=Menopon gallinae TaxID=328185 RepID=A0AAW2HH25_9NEOP